MDQSLLKQLLRYEPETGLFFWLVTHKNRKAGEIAGGKVPGGGGIIYWTIRVDGIQCRAHRLAWFYMTGEWPKGLIDHEDRNGLNNRWTNLREATVSQNKMNGKRYSSNSCGFKGVSRRTDGRYRARIGVGGKRVHLGNFADPAEAYAAYVAAAPKYHGEFARIA